VRIRRGRREKIGKAQGASSLGVGRAQLRVRRVVILAAVAAIAALGGCYRHSDMDAQPKFWKVYRPSEFFADGQSARPLPEGVVPIEWLRTNREFFFAKDESGRLIDHLPATGQDDKVFPPMTDPYGNAYADQNAAMAAFLKRGQARYNIYCIVCHGPLGYGDGLIVQRGFPAPPSFHSDKMLHHEPIGHIYDVISNGYGAMFSYAERVLPADRWAIAAYIKALQLSQNPTAQDIQNAKALPAAGAGGAQ
jgi:mono/diheme cytochrome c family protein